MNDPIDPADQAGLELLNAALGGLAQGKWTADTARIAAAMAAAPSSAVKARLANLLTHHHFTQGALDEALDSCEAWIAHAPDEVSARDSKGSILIRQGRWDDLIAITRARLADEAANHRLHSALANAYWRKGDTARAREHGEQALVLQDREHGGSAPAPSSTVPPFDRSAKARNVIAFSLYGSAAKYCDGAIRNAVAARHVYPEWTCRIYHDASVPPAVLKRLAALGAQVISVDRLPAARFGTFWRFLVADDLAVDRYLLRDCDACVSLRERAAVEEWIASGRHFHLMRDGFTHTDLILAGMWGGVRGALPPVGQGVIDWSRTGPFTRTADQTFLRERLWATVRQSLLAHDSCFRVLDGQPFPAAAEIPGPRVGEAVTSPPIS